MEDKKRKRVFDLFESSQEHKFDESFSKKNICIERRQDDTCLYKRTRFILARDRYSRQHNKTKKKPNAEGIRQSRRLVDYH